MPFVPACTVERLHPEYSCENILAERAWAAMSPHPRSGHTRPPILQLAGNFLETYRTL
jgi:hypothetical protein